MDSFSLHESRQHGSPDFPFSYFFVDETHPRYQMPYHWHKEWEIIHVISGEIHLTLDDAVYTAKAGEVFLVRDGMLHSGIPEQGCVYECFLLDLHRFFQFSEPIKKHLRPIYRKCITPQLQYSCDEQPELRHLIGNLSEVCREHEADAPSDDAFELCVFGFISQFFAMILQQKRYSDQPRDSFQNTLKIDQIKNVLSHIEENFASNLSLENLAAIINMNPRYFCRFFQSIMHISPMAYVVTYRVEKAAELLQNTPLSVLQICMDCGFNDCSHFIKVFKKHKGCTPNQYRKTQR